MTTINNLIKLVTMKNPINFILISVFTLIVMVFSVGILNAENNSVKGNYTGVTTAAGLWSNSANWNPALTPDPTNDRCNLTINHNITYNPGANPWLWGSNIYILIKSGATLTINADLSIDSNFDFIIEPGGKLIINGNLTFVNNVQGNIAGEMYVSENIAVGGGAGSNITGTGDIIVDGDITGNTGAITPTLIVDIVRWLIVNNGDWNLSASWSKTEGGIPAISAPNDQCIVKIPNALIVTVNSNITIKTLEVQAGGILNIAAGKTLTITNTASNSGNIVIKSDATGTGGFIYNGTGNIAAKVERYITANEFHYVSSSLSAAPVSSFNVTSGGYINPNFYYFDEAQTNADMMYGWKQASSGNLVVGKGYALYTDENYAYKLQGGYLQNSAVNVPITNTASAGGSKSWNLIGNPFPCSINANTFIDANVSGSVFTGALYFWDDDGSNGTGYSNADYLVYTKGGGTSCGNGSIFNGIIAPSQAFFIQANISGNLNFPVSSKTTVNATFTKSSKSSSTDDMEILRVSVSNSTGLYNDILIKFAADASEEVDIYDGRKLKGNTNIAFYSLLNNEEYAIQGFPIYEEELSVNLGLDVKIEGSYKIKAEDFVNINETTEVYLEDSYTEKMIDLRTSDYEFTSSGNTTDRFVIHFNKSSAASSIDSEILNTLSEASVYAYERNLFVNKLTENSQVTIIDITGKNLKTLNAGIGNNSFSLDFNTGYYIVKISNNNSSFSQKIFIK